jgi:hypothetical protein
MLTASIAVVAILSVALQSATVASGATHKLADYVSREWPGESHQQAITSTALTLLADAIEANAPRPSPGQRDLAAEVVRLRQHITEYRTGAPGDLKQSRRLRRLLIDASALIEELIESSGVRQRPRDPRLNALERSATSLSEDAAVIRQPDVLERFFRHAVAALQRLDDAPDGMSS